MNKLGKTKQPTLGGIVVSILVFIGLVILVIWAIGDGGTNESEKLAIGGAKYLIKIAISILILIGLIVIITILFKKLREEHNFSI